MRIVALVIIAVFAINYSYFVDNDFYFITKNDKTKLEVLQSNYKKLQCDGKLTNYNKDSCVLLKYKLDLEYLAYTLDKNNKELVIAYDKLNSLVAEYNNLVKKEYEQEYRLVQSRPKYNKKRVYAAK